MKAIASSGSRAIRCGRPKRARNRSVSAFINARFDKIEALRPDLVLAFSDLQADIAAELIRRGYQVVTFNQRSIAEILQMIRHGRGSRRSRRSRRGAGHQLTAGLDEIRAAAARMPRRPRVFFEEWETPLISGICWVDELIEIAGGQPIFPELRSASLAKHRIVAPADVILRDPEVIVASWCGKGVKKKSIVERAGLGRGQRGRKANESTRSSRRTSCSRARHR